MTPQLDPNLRKTLALAGLAVLALGVLLLAMQASQQRAFWREVDDWRTDNRYAEFLAWEREQRDDHGDDS